MRVAVVGAGLAGLAAADALRHEGADVVVLEARDRVGGRVWSQQFAGGVAERGAEFVFPSDGTLQATAERLGLRLARKGTRYGEREPRGGAPVADADLLAAVDALGSAVGDTVAEALASLSLPDGVREAIAARIEVSSAHPAEDLDATVLSETGAGFGSFETYGIAGGNGRLAEALAAPLGPELHLGAPVEAIGWDERCVRVRAPGLELEADRAVVAVPASAASRIRFEPQLAETKARALACVRYGQAAKLHVAMRGSVPPSATLAVPDRFWCYTQLGPDGRPAPLLTSFAGTRRALERLEVDDGPSCWLARVRDLRPDLDLDGGRVLLTTWHDDPWTSGAYSARSRSSPLDSAELARPLGALAFAGEHTAGHLHGLMEGALVSGLRAADQVLGRA